MTAKSPGWGLFFDKNGELIDVYQFETLFADMDYRRIGLDHVGPYHVSTVWLGINYNFSRQGPPIIFETMVFVGVEADDPLGMDMFIERYATEEQARQGHADLITLINATYQEVPSENVQHSSVEESNGAQ